MLERFRNGKSAKDLNIPVYTNWDDFEADQVDELDGNNALLQSEHEHLVPEELIKKHLEEQ